MSVRVEAVGVIGPGLEGWAAARPMLRGQAPYAAAPLPTPRTDLLGANERRRTTPVIRLAMQAAEDALRGSSRSAAELHSVFASATGDMEIVERICTALCTPGRPVSPTQFHNSVHNAPAGYWSLGAAARTPSTSIGAHDLSFCAGLLEAWSSALVEQRPVLLVAYDWPPPARFQPHRPAQHAFAAALLLAPDGPGAAAAPALEIDLQPAAGSAPSTMTDPLLETLRRQTPAARALPLLAALAGPQAAEVRLAYGDDRLLRLRCRPA